MIIRLKSFTLEGGKFYKGKTDPLN